MPSSGSRAEVRQLLKRMQTACKSTAAYLDQLEEWYGDLYPEEAQYVQAMKQIYAEFIEGVMFLDRTV